MLTAEGAYQGSVQVGISTCVLRASTQKAQQFILGGCLAHRISFSRALHKLRQQEAEDVFGEKLQHESVLVNDVLRAARWEAMRVWFWKSKVHINLLETSVVASLLKQMMRSPSWHQAEYPA